MDLAANLAVTPAPSPDTGPTPDPVDYPLRAKALRFILINELMHHPERRIADLVATVGRYGYTLTGRASKVISDALRWEIRRGRVQRLGRGRYRYTGTPRSTARRIQLLANASHRWIVARTRNEPLPPTPPACPHRYPWAYLNAHLPPWYDLQWLWTR